MRRVAHLDILRNVAFGELAFILLAAAVESKLHVYILSITNRKYVTAVTIIIDASQHCG